MQAQGKEMHMFTLGQPDFQTPEYISEVCKKAIDDGYTTYPDYSGTPAFRQTVCDKYEIENGLKFDEQQVMSTCGAAQAVYLVLTSFLNPQQIQITPEGAAVRQLLFCDFLQMICGAAYIISAYVRCLQTYDIYACCKFYKKN